jgi:phosphoribosyl 1,2-cyclic phosphodiesterase
MGHPDTSSLTIRFRGVRGSIPSPGMETSRYGGNTSCVELRTGEDILILDAGTGIRSLGNDLNEEFGSQPVKANLLISHTHWDHIQGLPFFAPLYSSQNRIRVIGANRDSSTIEEALRDQMRPIYFPVGLDQMPGLVGVEQLTSNEIRLGEFVMAITALNHPGGCAGFRIAARGATVAYLPDHEPYHSLSRPGGDLESERRREELAQFVRGVDLLILDTQYTHLEYPRRIGWGHGCMPDSVALAIEADARQLSFFHHDPSHHDTQIDAMVNDARKLVGLSQLRISAAVEMQALMLGPGIDNGSVVSDMAWPVKHLELQPH